jgi:hypothetical protein
MRKSSAHTKLDCAEQFRALACSAMAQWMGLGDFPNEILLQIFSFLPLKALITGRTIFQEWRRLIPLSDITPIRAHVDPYLTLANSPTFSQTRP